MTPSAGLPFPLDASRCRTRASRVPGGSGLRCQVDKASRKPWDKPAWKHGAAETVGFHSFRYFLYNSICYPCFLKFRVLRADENRGIRQG